MASLKTNRQVFREVWSLPHELHFENYPKAWSQIRLGDYFFNSCLIVLSSVLLILLVSAPAAYVLSRVKFRGSNDAVGEPP